MERFKEVTPGLLRGGVPSAKDLAMLKDVWNVHRIVSLDAGAASKIAPICKQLGLEHIIVPIEDDGTAVNSINYLRRNIRALLTTNPAVYVHCFHGKDRTGLAIAMYRVTNGWTCDAALREARTFGFGIGLNQKAKKLYTAAICGADLVNGTVVTPTTDDNSADTSAVGQARKTIDPNTLDKPTDSRHSFSPITPTHEQLSDPVESPTYQILSLDDKKHDRKRKMRKLVLEDLNDAMAEVGTYDNINPVIRGLGPLEPCGISPYGNYWM
jgi:hypothetical protein